MTAQLAIRDVIRTGPPTTDRNGLLFQADGRVLRAFRGAPAALYRRMLDADWLPDLLDAGVVPFRRSDIALEGYELVVEAERVPVVSYPPEWPNAMLAEAGATIARVGHVLSRHGHGLQDAHPWNVLFHGPRATFIDLGSIVQETSLSAGWMDEFRRYIVLPLALQRRGLHLPADAIRSSQRSEWIRAFERVPLRRFPLGYGRLRRLASSPSRFFAELERFVLSISAEAARTEWSTYYVEGDARVGEHDRYNEKQRAVDEMLAELPPGTLLDVGSNEGWYSRLAVSKGHTVIAIDKDDRALSALYAEARRVALPILPLRMDFMWPTGSSGFALEYAPAPERLRSDTVLALAVLHHLARQHVFFEAFARVVDMFAKRFAIVEFIPGEDRHVRGWPLARESWYTLDNLVQAMLPFFFHRRTLPSTPEPRVVLLFERRT